MASNTYTQYYADGATRLVRRVKKQGRNELPTELVKVKAEFMTLPATKKKVQEQAKKYGMTFSRYVDLAVSLFDISKFSSEENC